MQNDYSRSPALSRENLTLVFTDIQGYSELTARYRASFRPILERHNALVRTCAQNHGGREVKVIGDAFFLVFASPIEAVAFALEAQGAIQMEAWQIEGEPIDLRIRIGIHTGEAEEITHPDGQTDYIGADVNRASRVCSAAHGGQILLSETTYTALNHCPTHWEFRNWGVYWLKGVGQERLYQVYEEGLQAVLLPPNAPRAGAHNLMLAETSLIGRDREIRDLTAMLAQPHIHLVTLVGPSGVGKSRLAVAVAEAVLEQFPDGVWLVNLPETYTTESVFQSIAQALSLAVRGDRPLSEQVLAHLEGRSVLLVIDSAGSTEVLLQAIRQLLGVSKLKILLCHTGPLHLRAEHLYEVKPLAVPPAREGLTPQQIAQYPSVQLLLERVRHYKNGYAISAENAPALAALCRHLDGLPLGIELAAPRLAVMMPQEVLKRLDERFQILQSRNPDMPDRQRTLLGAIEWSYSQLTESARELLCQLGMFAGSFTLTDAEAVCESFMLVEDLLELRQHALVIEEHQKDAQLFRLLNPLRLFARNRLREHPELHAQVSQRYAHYFLQMALQAGRQIRTPHEMEALRLVERHLEDFQQALGVFEQGGDLNHAVQLATALIKLTTRLGLLYSAHQSLERALHSLAQIGSPPAEIQADLLMEHAGLLYETHDWEHAWQRAEQALVLYEQLNRRAEQAQAHNLLGLIALRRRDYENATRQFELALQAFEEARQPVWQAAVRNNLGLVAYETGDYDLAEAQISEAVQQQRRLGDMRGLAESLTNLGAVSFLKEDYESALRHFSDALRYEIELNDRIGVARCLCNLGETLMQNPEQARQAARYLLAAECVFDRYGSPDVAYVRSLLNTLALDEPTLAQLRAHALHCPCEELVYWAQSESFEEPADSQTV